MVRYSTKFSYSETDWNILREFWHPVAYSDLVTEQKMEPTQLLDVPLVVTRKNGVPLVFQDLCPHRGAPLSSGKWVGGNLECPYHAFRYNSEGVCVNQKNTSAALNKFPAIEKYGTIWTCLAGEAKYPLPEWPDRKSVV